LFPRTIHHSHGLKILSTLLLPLDPGKDRSLAYTLGALPLQLHQVTAPPSEPETEPADSIPTPQLAPPKTIIT